MDVSIFLAKLFGVTYAAVGLGILLNQKYFQKMYQDLMKSPGLMFYGGAVALVAGMVIVMFHNLWVQDWRVIITVLGWAAIVKGILLLVIPGAMTTMFKGWFKRKNAFIPVGILVLAFGFILAYLGFFAQ